MQQALRPPTSSARSVVGITAVSTTRDCNTITRMVRFPPPPPFNSPLPSGDAVEQSFDLHRTLTPWFLPWLMPVEARGVEPLFGT